MPATACRLLNVQQLGWVAMYDMEQNSGRSAAQGLQDGVRFLRRRRRTILLTALVTAALAFLLGQSLEPRYRSSAELIIESVPAANLEDEQAVNAMDESSFVDGQVLVLQSSDLLRRVLSDPELRNDPEIAGTEAPSFTDRAKAMIVGAAEVLGLTGGAEAAEEEADPMYRAIQRLRNMVSVLREGRSTVITVSVMADDPEKAARIANAIVENYITRQTESQSERALRVASRLNTRLTELRQQLLAAEDAVEAYRSQHGMISTGAGTLSEQELAELNGQLVLTRADLFQRQALLDRAQEILRTEGDIFSLQGLDSEVLSDLRLRLQEVSSRESELLNLFGEGNPSLGPVQTEKAALESQIQTEVERLVDTLSNELEVAKAREALLVSALNDASTKVTIEGQGAVELRELERVADAYSSVYQRLLERAGNVGALAGSASSDVRLISPAVTSSTPVFPPNRLIVTLGLILGAGLGVLRALLREAMNTGFVTTRQAEEVLGLPVLAALPETKETGTPRDVMLRSPDSPFAEAVRTLRHSLLANTDHVGAPVLQVTSALDGEGKTTVAMSLAISAAWAGGKVLVVDADLRRRGLTELLGASDRPGLTDIGVDAPTMEALIATDRSSGAFFLPAGRPTNSPPDFLESARMRAFLDWARTTFDLVILDSPKVANMADSVILAKYCDIVAFVVKWGSSPAEIVGDCLGRLDPIKVKGLALNAYNLREAASYGDNNARGAGLLNRRGRDLASVQRTRSAL
jgi:polysaccharide biosynthesis transport protein